jgi:mRNA interferase MazF
MSETYFPERGDVIWITLNPQSGHEQSGRRPALVISPAAYNLKVGLALLCLITNRKKGYPFEVEIPEELPISGVVLADQIKSADWKARNAEFICKIDSKITMEVLNKLSTLISI